MREARVRSSYIDHAKLLGFLHRKVRYEGRRGAPDDWFFGPQATLVIIEGKRPGETPRLQQFREIKRLATLGFNVTYANSIEQGIDILNAAARTFRPS